MDIAKTYSPEEIEDKWYSHWKTKGYFHSSPDDREPYTILIPPPNVTGVLHMGHMLNNTIQDILIRKARMEGKNACWVPGTDHASIATEAKVVAMLKEKGIEKSDLSREEFLKYAWEWKEKYGGIILKQLEKLGASCDWDRTRFTMEEELSNAVIDVFVDLYNKGYIYRGVRMVNWDPEGLTAISDEEVNHKEVDSQLYYVKYAIADSNDEYITIATTRPETILGDTAVCVHPDDDRYKHLKGKSVIIPIVNREVPIIFDDYITMEFGTGALKVTPAHDINDYNLGIKHKLQTIDVINDDGTMSEAAQFYIGEDRFAVRKKISKDLKEEGLLVKTENIRNKVGYSERTDAVIEPKLSMQWFMKMKDISKPAYEKVMDDTIHLIPEKFKNTYKHWMENVQDWCISRQLWWGHRIPAWHLDDGSYVVAKEAEQALALAKEKSGNSNLTLDDINQDEDVLDTWFSSWLWPISVFDGFKDPENEDIKYYYPTNDLVTAPEILFFWVARMIIAGYEYRNEKPFKNVYLTGIVRDQKRRKMSKSLGNSPEPLDLIKKYGADGVRVGMLFSSPAGNDLLFDEALCEQGRNFSNKIWNSFRLIKQLEIDDSLAQPESSKHALSWFDSKLNESTQLLNDHFSKYRISDALMTIYKLIWDDYCSWFLEIIKPAFGEKIDRATYESSIDQLESLLKLLHPFMPFISEEIWHLSRERREDLIVATYPPLGKVDSVKNSEFESVKEIVSSLRNFRSSKGLSPKDVLTVSIIDKEDAKGVKEFAGIISKLANLEALHFTNSAPEENASSFMCNTIEYYIHFEETLDVEAEKKRLNEELDYTKGFLNGVMKKLGNERFVSNAKPEVVESERKKKSDAESKIEALEKQIAQLN